MSTTNLEPTNEEFARLQEAVGQLDDQEFGKQLQERAKYSQNSLNTYYGDDMTQGATYAVMSSPSEARTPDLSTRSLITSASSSDIDIASTLSPEHVHYFSLQRAAFIIKLVIAIGFLFCIYSYIVRAWWLLFSFGWLFNPIGFYGAQYFKKRFILAFMVWLVVDAVFQFAYMFVTLNSYGGPGVILSLFFIFVQGYFLYYVFQFYKQLPRDGIWQRFVDSQPTLAVPLHRVVEE